MRVPLTSLLALGLAACPAATTSHGDAGTVPAEVDAVPDAGVPTVTARKIDAWLAYQRQLLSVPRADGGLGIVSRARLEQAVRLDAGLSEDDVDAIEDVVAAVVTARNLSKLTGVEAVREFEKVTSTLSAAQKVRAQQAMSDVSTRAQQAAALEAEKARFGAEAVQAVMAREAEVTKVWDTLVDAK